MAEHGTIRIPNVEYKERAKKAGDILKERSGCTYCKFPMRQIMQMPFIILDSGRFLNAAE